jgi:DNA-binding transcriptional LysR family regulator
MTSRTPYKDLHLLQLRSFCQVATQKSFAAVAKAVGISRSAVWQQVRALERRLGVTLVRCHDRQLELTPEGHKALDLLLPHVNAIDSLDRLMESQQPEFAQKITIVSNPNLFSYHLRQPLQEFIINHPACRLNLISTMWTQQIIEQLEHSRADVGVFTCDSSEPRSHRLEYQDLFDVPLQLLTGWVSRCGSSATVLPM